MAIDKAQQEALADKNTIVIVPDFGEEQKLAVKWLRANAPKVITEQRMFNQLSLLSLQTDITIMTLTRSFEIPIQKAEIDNAGFLQYYNRPDAELMDEMRLSKPIKVAGYWRRDNPMRPGRVDTAGILEELGKQITPWRFDYIDKGAERPELLVLTQV